MTFRTFLRDLSRVERLNVSHIGSKHALALPYQIFVGCSPVPGQAHAGPTLVLNNKVVRNHRGHSYSSITRLVTQPPSGFFDGWLRSFQERLSPFDIVCVTDFVVEDASPDSIVGVLLVLARTAGVDLNDVAGSWISAVDDWEVTGNAEEPSKSWCALASALAHRNFKLASQGSAAELENAWRECLHFAAGCLVRDVSPIDLPALRELPEWASAIAALEQEYEAYLDFLSYASIVQLSLPLAGTPNHRLIVDSLLFAEDQVTGSTKSFYRNDRKLSPLGVGFSFAANYRPSLIGTGNEITIAVDPRRGIELIELWKELEAQETAAWEAANVVRPFNNPRDLPGLSNQFDQPWFINEQRTLIGAPRRLRDGSPGSRLSWDQVQQLIWKVYNPLRNVRVLRSEGTKEVLLSALPEENLRNYDGAPSGEKGKKLFLAQWPAQADVGPLVRPRALSRAPVVFRAIAALIQYGTAVDIPLAQLPQNGNWCTLTLTGGIGVITHHGAFILDDWTPERLSLQSLKAAFELAAQFDKELRNLEEEASLSLAADLRKTLEERSVKSLTQMTLNCASLRSRLAALRGSYGKAPGDPNAHLLRDALDNRWALERRLTSAELQVRAIEESLRSLGELRTIRTAKFIATYGFAIFVASGLSPFVAKVWDQFVYGDVPNKDAPGGVVLVWFLAIFTLFSLGIGAFSARENPLRGE